MLQFACEARVRVSGSVNHFPNFVIGAVRGPLKIIKKGVGSCSQYKQLYRLRILIKFFKNCPFN